MYPCFLVLFVFLLFITGCNYSDSSNAKEKCVINERSLQCNGGYSYWISPLYSLSDSVLAITGVAKENNKSQQWVVFLNDDLTEIYHQFSFEARFISDEHNAPAVLALKQGKWIVARTGHNDTFSGSGIVEVTIFNKELNVERSLDLKTKSGSTYVQLVEVNDSLYLLTRDTSESWGAFISNDGGDSWLKWQALALPEGLRTYVLIEKERKATEIYERIIIHKGNHPIHNQQTIAYSYLDLDDYDPALQTDKAVSFDDDNIKSNNDYNIQLSQQSPYSTNIRLLDSYNKENNLCHLYSTINRTTNKWKLNILTKSASNSSSHLVTNKNYFLGSYSGILGEGSYITGASIKVCNLFDGGQIEVFVSHEINNTYHISVVSLDYQTGEILSTEHLYSTKNQLYRPVYIEELDYIMFNEASYWESYESWKAKQVVIPL